MYLLAQLLLPCSTRSTARGYCSYSIFKVPGMASIPLQYYCMIEDLRARLAMSSPKIWHLKKWSKTATIVFNEPDGRPNRCLRHFFQFLWSQISNLRSIVLTLNLQEKHQRYEEYPLLMSHLYRSHKSICSSDILYYLRSQLSVEPPFYKKFQTSCTVSTRSKARGGGTYSQY